MNTLAYIEEHGAGGIINGRNNIKCADGFRLSVVANEFAYCSPRDNRGPWRTMEVGYPSERPEPWNCTEWAEGFDGHSDHMKCDGWVAYVEDAEDPTGTVYGYVPVDLIRSLIESHGGEA